MKNIYGKIINNKEDDRPIPQLEDNLYNNLQERELPSEFRKVKDFYKSQKTQNKEK